MKFLDEVSITVCSGRGGDGCMSFLRRANFAKGGPDGGNGGHGGSVYLVGDSSLTTLVDLQYQPIQKAGNGRPGGSANKRGAQGSSLEIRVPFGTTIVDDETLSVLGDVTHENQRVKVAEGGSPGRGNASFKTSTNRAPREFTTGTSGVRRILRLQLKVVADVGLLGLPNAGKTTLLSRISEAHPKIADYPFTTLRPHLGVVRPQSDNSFVVADIPGLIRGASEGLGLGTRFLRHLSRTCMLVHLIEVNPPDGSDPIQNLLDIEQELARYSTILTTFPIVVVLSKVDLLPKSEWTSKVNALKQRFPDRQIHAISAVSNIGIEQLLTELSTTVQHLRNGSTEDLDAELEERDRRAQLAKDVLVHSMKDRTRIQAKDDSELRNSCP